MRGFISVCFVLLFGCVFSSAVLAQTTYYWRHPGNSVCGAQTSHSADSLASLVCSAGCAGARRNVKGNYSGTSGSFSFQCCSGVSTGCQSMFISRLGDSCPAGETLNPNTGGCTGPEPAPPAKKGDPCMGGGGPPGDSSSRVDPANCSIYAYSGPAPSWCLVGGTKQPCPCWDGRCSNIYCPTGEQKDDCVPAGWSPSDPDAPPPYLPDPNQSVPDGDCTATTGCDGSPPSSPPPPNAGEPDPSDPDGGSHGDVPQQRESTSTTGADGSSTTTERETSWNPYSQETVVRETTTHTNPDGSTVQEKTTTTSGGTAGGGTSRTTTKVTTRTAADGTVTVETEGSSESTEQEEEAAPDSTASGGINCSSEPVCTGDAVQCGILKQIWRDNCVFSKISGGDTCASAPVCDVSQIACANALQAWHDRCPQGAADQAGINAVVDALVPSSELTVSELDAAAAADPDYDPDAVVDLASTSIGPTNPSPSGSCPLPFSIVVMGVDVEIGSVELCDFTDWISWLVRISASLFALFIITGYGVGRSTGGA